MLKIEHINITFQRPVITDSTLTLYPNEITLLSGESGSGKTSLLHIIGLLDEDSSYSYTLDGKTIQRNEYEHLKRSMISYVFQDYNLLEDFSVLDNFKTMFNIAGLSYSKDKVLSLLKLVSIDETKLKQKSKSLSGGEKQRLAIALALVKEPSILILDEPTANLDEENIKGIVSILHHLKEEGYMIVVASHHAHLYHADRIYHIQDTKLIEEGIQREEVKNREVNETRKKFNIFSYSFNHVTRHIVLYTIMLIAIAFALQSLMFNVRSVAFFKLHINQDKERIQQSEIVVSNIEENDFFYTDPLIGITPYNHNYFNFSQEYFDQIAEIEHIKTVYSYHNISSSDVIIYDLEGNRIRIDETEKLSTVKGNGKEINTYDTLEERNIQTVTCNEETMIGRSSVIDEQVEHGVFIKRELADALGITELNHTKIQFPSFYVLGSYETIQSYYSEEGKMESKTSQSVIAVIVPTTYEIKGIVDQVNENKITSYSSYFGESIFVDYREYEKQQEYYLKDKELLNTIYNDIDEAGLVNAEGEPSKIVLEKTPSCTLIVEVDQKYIDEVGKAIQSIDDTRLVKTPKLFEQQAQTIFYNYSQNFLLQPILLTLVIVLLCAFIFMILLRGRKKEISLLKANGIRSISSTILFDYVYIFVLALPIGMVRVLKDINDYKEVPLLWKNIHQIYLITIGSAFLTFVILVVVSYFIQKVYVKRIQTLKELRSK